MAKCCNYSRNDITVQEFTNHRIIDSDNYFQNLFISHGNQIVMQYTINHSTRSDFEVLKTSINYKLVAKTLVSISAVIQFSVEIWHYFARLQSDTYETILCIFSTNQSRCFGH